MGYLVMLASNLYPIDISGRLNNHKTKDFGTSIGLLEAMTPSTHMKLLKLNSPNEKKTIQCGSFSSYFNYKFSIP